MADVIHEHTTTERGGNGNGFLIGIILLVVILLLLFYYGLPALRGATSGGAAPQVNVPGRVDVNVKSGGK